VATAAPLIHTFREVLYFGLLDHLLVRGSNWIDLFVLHCLQQMFFGIDCAFHGEAKRSVYCRQPNRRESSRLFCADKKGYTLKKQWTIGKECLFSFMTFADSLARASFDSNTQVLGLAGGALICWSGCQHLRL
jgi:hypothetical protein